MTDVYDEEIDYWVKQGLVDVDDDGMYRITETGLQDPIVSAVFDSMIAEELTNLIEKGLLECWWDTEAGDMVYQITDLGRQYVGEV